MALVVISIDRSKLPEHTDKDFEEWVRFCVHDRCDCSMENPLVHEDMNAVVREISR